MARLPLWTTTTLKPVSVGQMETTIQRWVNLCDYDLKRDNDGQMYGQSASFLVHFKKENGEREVR